MSNFKSVFAKIALAIAALTLTPTVAPAENRRVDGINNNLSSPTLGAAHTAFVRLAPANYDDGISAPTETGMRNAREVSNIVCGQTKVAHNGYSLSDFVWQWGQFIDHDITLSETSEASGESFPIAVAAGDPLTPFIPLSRTIFDPQTGMSAGDPRQQMNSITAFVDASMVYGSDSIRAAALRTFSDGRLKTSAGNLLPFNVTGLPNANAPGLPEDSLFAGGDVRCNEQLGLTCMHTVFVREHNRLAAEIATAHPMWSDEQIYQRARKIVGALVQSVTYNEFLPAFIGSHAPDIGSLTYNPAIDPSISNEFATALYRVGHTMVSEALLLLENDGSPAATPEISIFQAFFSPDTLATDPGKLDQIIKGLATHAQEGADTQLVDDFRNQLFGPIGAGGMDLAALNIQRGREHGLSSYNTVREALGLAKAADFGDVSSDPATIAALEAAYSNVDQIDLWVGALAEDHAPGCAVGELISTALGTQFTALVEGDRFFFLFDPELDDLRSELMETKLSDILMRNTSVTTLQENVFFAPLPDGALQLSVEVDPTKGDVLLSSKVAGDKTYSLRRSPDLQTWETIQTDLSAFGTINITDSEVANSLERAYYQLVEEVR